MLERFTREMFQTRVGERLRVRLPSGTTLDLELSGVRPLVDHAGDRLAEGHREPFALTFTGPEGIGLPQATYHFTHDDLGEFEMFIVPIERVGNRLTFEAIFT